MSRRTLLRGLVGASAALILPPSVVDAADEVSRRWWALGEMPGRDPRIIDMWEQDFIQTPRYDANMDWRTVYTGVVIRVDRHAPPEVVGLQYVKVPTRPVTFSMRAEWL